MDEPFDLSHRSAAGLTNGQLGRYGEDLARLLLGRLGYDVYRAAVDDKGIDLVIRSAGGRPAEVQVKAIRPQGKSSLHLLREGEVGSREPTCWTSSRCATKTGTAST